MTRRTLPLPTLLLLSASVQAQGLRVQLHPKTGDPVLTWGAERGEGDYFSVYRGRRPGVATDAKHLVRTRVAASRYFDHHTFPGETYHYRVAKVEADGTVGPLPGEVRITSRKNCYSVEGELPVVMGWAWPRPELVELGINLTMRDPKVSWDTRLPLYNLSVYGYSKDPARDRLAPHHWGWELYDEKHDPKPQLAKVAALRQIDPYAPTFGNVMSQAAFGAMARVPDIHCADPYWSKSSMPAFITPLMRRAASNTIAEKIPLDGKWRFIAEVKRKFAFTRMDYDDSAWREVEIVGTGWNEYWRKNFVGSGYYRKEFRLPASFKGREIRLAFEGVDEEGEFFLNGWHIGSHRHGPGGWNTTVELDATQAAKPGEENILFVQVDNSMLMGGLYVTPYVFVLATDVAPTGPHTGRLPRQLAMCFDVFSHRQAIKPFSFHLSSWFTFLAYGGKMVYLFNWPTFSDGPGASTCPRRLSAIAVLTHELRTWGRHLLQAHFRSELQTDSPRNSDLLGRGTAYEHRSGRMRLFRGMVRDKAPDTIATWLSHPRGHFLFVMPMEEVGYFTERVTVELPDEIPAAARAWRITGDGLRPLSRQSASLPVSDVAVYGAVLLTEDQGFANGVNTEIASGAERMRELLQEDMEIYQRDTASLGELTGASDTISPPAKETNAAQLAPLRLQAEVTYQRTLQTHLSKPSPYSQAPKVASVADLSKSDEPTAPDLLLPDYARGARAVATYNVYRFKRGPHDADLVLGEQAESESEWMRARQGKGWRSAARATEPHPTLTVTLPKEQKIGRARIKLALPDPKQVTDARAVELIALEFPASQTACVYRLRATPRYQELRFAPKQEREVRLVVLRVSDARQDFAGDIAPFSVLHFELLPPSDECPDKDRNSLPIAKVRQPTMSRFGW